MFEHLQSAHAQLCAALRHRAELKAEQATLRRACAQAEAAAQALEASLKPRASSTTATPGTALRPVRHAG